MTTSSSTRPANPQGRALTLGSLLGAGLSALAIAGALGFGAVPAEATTYVLLGFGAALLAGFAAWWIHRRLLALRGGTATVLTAQLQGLLAASFGAKLFVLLLGALALHFAGVKFAEVAAFAISFAGTSIVCQLSTALCLARTVGASGRVGNDRTPNPADSHAAHP